MFILLLLISVGSLFVKNVASQEYAEKVFSTSVIKSDSDLLENEVWELLVEKRGGADCRIVSPGGSFIKSQPHRMLSDERPVYVQQRPLIHHLTPKNGEHHQSEGGNGGEGLLLTVYGWDQESMLDYVKANHDCDSIIYPSNADAAEEEEEIKQQLNDAKVFPLSITGPAKNRIDVVFMGDGYTMAERDLFVEDMHRMIAQLSPTYKSVLPIMNFWGVHVPSQTSGVGIQGRAFPGSAFGLYRDGFELRAVYCSRPSAARAACKLTGDYACDYPSLIGNDDFYGGLGGQFAISTKSEISGVIVLRHEFGHNFVVVGEEYDGGQVYSGVNAVSSLLTLKSGDKWNHWLTTPSGVVREEKADLLLQDYPWFRLDQGKPWVKSFRSSGKYKRWIFKWTLSGIPRNEMLQVLIDDKPVSWNASGIKDRSFYEFMHTDGGFSQGEHTIKFIYNSSDIKNDIDQFDKLKEPARQLCNLEIIEYMDEDEYTFGDGNYSAYPTWSIYGGKTYRPTNEQCLMRNMTKTDLCSVCTEGLWKSFLQRVQLIDDLTVELVDGADEAKLKLTTVQLGQFRTIGTGAENEYLHISWLVDGELKWRDVTEVTVPTIKGRQVNVTVNVHFTTSQIRKEKDISTRDSRTKLV